MGVCGSQTGFRRRCPVRLGARGRAVVSLTQVKGLPMNHLRSTTELKGIELPEVDGCVQN